MTTADFSSLRDGHIDRLTEPADADPSAHQWAQPEIDALQLALATERPLLVRGEPGTGKTQLARAAAQHLGWQLLSVTIHPRYEPMDLIYRFDAIRRLADAQAGKRLKHEYDYWQPGPLWRAYGWQSAQRYGSCRSERTPPAGHVILIDEIDKADSDLPNSLLEVLGQRSFEVPVLKLRVTAPAGRRPLVLVTTNEERELPAAFTRRCLVLNLGARTDDRQWLINRATAHFGADAPAPPGSAPLPDPVIADAVDLLLKDRAEAAPRGLYKPGPAELLDLLAGVQRLAAQAGCTPGELVKSLSQYAFVKHSAEQAGGEPGLQQTATRHESRRPG